jgi:hypothetical protein
VVTRFDKNSSGRIARAKIKAAFIVVNEASKFNSGDDVLYFALGEWVELLTVVFIKFSSNEKIEKEVKRMTFMLFYLKSPDSFVELSLNNRMIVSGKHRPLFENLLVKTEMFVNVLGDECLGHRIDFSSITDQMFHLLMNFGENLRS